MSALRERRVARVERRRRKIDAERIAKIRELLALNAEHVAKIEELLALNAERVAKIEQLAAENAGRPDPWSVGRLLELLDTNQRLSACDAERVAKIEAMATLDAERVAKIEWMADLDTERVAKIEEMAARAERMRALDAERVARLESMSAAFSAMDGLSVTGRNLSFLDEPGFASAWQRAAAANAEGWPGGVPDIRWRAHIALWAARHGLKLEGDFVECGVHTGLLSMVICHALDFGGLGRRFHLFDTYAGCPLEGLEGEELERAKERNTTYYNRDVWNIAERNFAPFKNARLVRGVLPESLCEADIERIAYLSVDLNNARAEHEVANALWDRVAPNAMIVIDDYAFTGHEAQFAMWNTFAAARDVHIATLPTGQGLIVKP